MSTKLSNKAHKFHAIESAPANCIKLGAVSVRFVGGAARAYVCPQKSLVSRLSRTHVHAHAHITAHGDHVADRCLWSRTPRRVLVHVQRNFSTRIVDPQLK